MSWRKQKKRNDPRNRIKQTFKVSYNYNKSSSSFFFFIWNWNICAVHLEKKASSKNSSDEKVPFRTSASQKQSQKKKTQPNISKMSDASASASESGSSDALSARLAALEARSLADLAAGHNRAAYAWDSVARCTALIFFRLLLLLLFCFLQQNCSEMNAKLAKRDTPEPESVPVAVGDGGRVSIERDGEHSLVHFATGYAFLFFFLWNAYSGCS